MFLFCFFVEEPTPSKKELQHSLALFLLRFFNGHVIFHNAGSVEELTEGIAPEAANTPSAIAMVPHPYCSDKVPAITGPKSVAAAIEQLKRAKP